MTTEDDAQAAITEARDVLSQVHKQLLNFAPPTEQLANIIVPKQLFGIQRRGRLTQAGEVWHLGIFLIDTTGTLFRAGETVRSENMAHTDHNSAYKTLRREYSYAVFRAGYPAGTVVNFGATRIDIDEHSLRVPAGPLFVRGHHTFVRWRSGAPDAEAVPLSEYLAERLNLLVKPPTRSTD